MTRADQKRSVAVGLQEINCSPDEFATLEPTSGGTCGSYLQQYISNSGGYVTNPDATSACQYCISRTTDEYLGPSFNVFYSNHWRDFGLLLAYIAFNVSLLLLFPDKCNLRTAYCRYF
jgi:ATP-binding cassette, subfamily G (WHITE), member 2, SNQ2